VPPTTTPAPRRLRLRKGMVGFTMPPGASTLVDGLVGTFLGSTRSEVLRFIVVSWIADHHAEIKQIIEGRSRRRI
jgi:hypothetical protein